MPKPTHRNQVSRAELEHQLESARSGLQQLLNHSKCDLYRTDPALYYALYYWIGFMSPIKPKGG